MGFTFLDEVLAFLPGHVLLKRLVHVPIDVGGARAANGELLSLQGAAQGNRIDLPTVLRVPATNDHTSCRE